MCNSKPEKNGLPSLCESISVEEIMDSPIHEFEINL